MDDELRRKEIEVLKAEQKEMLKLIQKLAKLINLKPNQDEINRINQNVSILNRKLSELSGIIYKLEIEHQKNMKELYEMGRDLDNQIVNAQRSARVQNSPPFNGFAIGY